MKIIVAGSRTFMGEECYQVLKQKMDKFTRNIKKVVVLSGAARGADAHGERWAYERMHTVMRFHPDYQKHGKAAPLIRNEEMAKEADACICFWDGQSTGTAHMIKMAKKYKLQLKIVEFEYE